jgi:hypothetical protein
LGFGSGGKGQRGGEDWIGVDGKLFEMPGVSAEVVLPVMSTDVSVCSAVKSVQKDADHVVCLPVEQRRSRGRASNPRRSPSRCLARRD